MEELSNENLMELEKELNDGDKSSDVNPLKPLSTKQLTEFFKHFNTGIGITYDNDAKRERSIKSYTVIESAVACYKELNSERQKAAFQLSLRNLFKRVETCQFPRPCKRACPT
jgi:hypothetical protein